MKAITVCVLAGVIVAAALAGCGGPFRARQIDNKVLESERIVYLDRKVRSYLGAREMPPKRLDGGELQAEVVVLNRKGKDLRCDVKVQFIDVDGSEVDATTWEPRIFEARMEQTIRKNSLDPAAADYRLCIRVQK